MSVKRYKLALPTSSQRIRKAKTKLKQMTKLRKIELMVEAGAMTRKSSRAGEEEAGGNARMSGRRY